MKNDNKKLKEFQINFSYNTNKIEGSYLELAQVRNIFEGKRPQIKKSRIREETLLNLFEIMSTLQYMNDDITECENHFKCVELAIQDIKEELSKDMVKEFHYLLMKDTYKSKQEWFVLGNWKKVPNYIAGNVTALPSEVLPLIEELLQEYNRKEKKSLEDIIKFHCEYEMIHPFSDGNGRTGRLIMFRECLKNDIKPFIVEYATRDRYYRGLSEYRKDKEKGIKMLKKYFTELQKKDYLKNLTFFKK